MLFEDVKSRHDDIIRIEKSIREMNEIFQDMSLLIRSQVNSKIVIIYFDANLRMKWLIVLEPTRKMRKNMFGKLKKMFKMLKEQGNGQLKFVFYLEWLENQCHLAENCIWNLHYNPDNNTHNVHSANNLFYTFCL